MRIITSSLQTQVTVKIAPLGESSLGRGQAGQAVLQYDTLTIKLHTDLDVHR